MRYKHILAWLHANLFNVSWAMLVVFSLRFYGGGNNTATARIAFILLSVCELIIIALKSRDDDDAEPRVHRQSQATPTTNVIADMCLAFAFASSVYNLVVMTILMACQCFYTPADADAAAAAVNGWCLDKVDVIVNFSICGVSGIVGAMFWLLYQFTNHQRKCGAS